MDEEGSVGLSHWDIIRLNLTHFTPSLAES